MSVITRRDGTQFAVYCYRELLAETKPSLLKQELLDMQHEHGHYARFFPQPDGDVEVVFSPEPGYLLGESLWEFFESPYDFIFCEALPDNDHAILVVVRAGSVYIDAAVPNENLIDEFAALVTGQNQYDIYIHGDVPLAEEETEGKYSFQSRFVHRFTELSDPVFENFTPSPAYKLLSIDKALKELNLGKDKTPQYLVMALIGFVAAFFLYQWLTPNEVEVAEPVSQPVKPAPPPAPKPTRDPYDSYRRALSTPAPSAQLIEIAEDLKQLFGLPGWSATRYDFNGLTATASLKSVGGSTQILLAWVRQTNDQLEVYQGQASLAMTSKVPDRKPPTVIYNLRDIVTKLYDGLTVIFPNDKISLGETSSEDNYKTARLTITLNNDTIENLILLAQTLEGLPLVLERCQLNINDGLLTGSLELKVLGAA